MQMQLPLASLLLLAVPSCSESAIYQNDNWHLYEDKLKRPGQHASPIKILIRNGSITVNGKNYTRPNLINFLKRSKNLSPIPEILVSFSEEDKEYANNLTKRIDELGLCLHYYCSYEKTTDTGHAPRDKQL